MTRISRLIYALSFIIASAGLFVPLWPLCVAGILIAALMGMLIDVAWGTPAGILHYLYFPFTLLALVAGLAHYVMSGYFLDRTPPDTL